MKSRARNINSCSKNTDKFRKLSPENTQEIELEINQPGPGEEKIIAAQLDSEIIRVLRIVKRCPAGFPQLLLLKPFSPVLISPTIFWLSCPVLRERISRLEDRGLLEELTARYQNQQDFACRLDKAHQAYAALRRKLLSPGDREEAEEISQDLLDTLLNSGVGGIKDRGGLKCLHAHFAHYYAGSANPAGSEVAARLSHLFLCRYCKKFSRKLSAKEG